MITARLIVRGMSVQLIGRAVGLLLSLATLTLTVRYLGASEYGVLVTVVAFCGLFETFVDLGVGTLIVRRVAGGSDSLERLVGLNLAMSFVYAGPLWLLATIAGILVYADRPQIQLGVAIVAVGLVFRAISTCFVPIYEIAIRFGAITAADLSSRAAALALVILAIQVNAAVITVISIQVVAPFIALIFMVAIVRRRGRFRPVFQRREALSLLRESLPLASVNLAAVLYLRADGVLLSLLSTTKEVGAYGLAYRITSNATVVATVFAASAFSTLTRAWAHGRADFNKVLTRSLNFMLLCATPLLILGIMLGPDLVTLIASSSFTGSAGRAIQLLSAATAVLYLNIVLAQAMIAAHRQRFLFYLVVIALVANVAMNVILVPSRGAEGAGIALLSSELLSLLLAAGSLRRVTRYRLPWNFAGRLLVPVALTVGVLWIARDQPVLVRLLLLGIVYPASVLLTGPVSLDDLKLLWGGRGTASAASSTQAPKSSRPDRALTKPTIAEPRPAQASPGGHVSRR
jgi:O-antigen/teichoic acid export membrane protein